MPLEPLIDAKKPSILIVDDSIENLRLLSEMLLEQGMEPRPLSRSKLAIAAARTDPPDLILLDIDMPEVNGFAVCKGLKDDDSLKDIPVIFISGLTGTTDILRALALGGVDYVTKPFQTEEILARIRTHLRIRSLQCQLNAQNHNLEQQVVARTRDLAHANRRLSELGRLKDDFLTMIAHELRTPANGLFGFSELIIDLCEPSETLAQYHHYYNLSKARLLDLITDSSLIAEMTEAAPQVEQTNRLGAVFAQLRLLLPHLQISVDREGELESLSVLGEQALLMRAMRTVFLLACSFSMNKDAVHPAVTTAGGLLTLRFPLDALRLPSADVAGFFEVESSARSSSCAEPLGLSPVVAHRILSALGGDLRLVKEGSNAGFLEAIVVTD